MKKKFEVTVVGEYVEIILPLGRIRIEEDKLFVLKKVEGEVSGTYEIVADLDIRGLR